MTDDVRFSALRRKLLAGLGAAAIGGVTASAVGRAAPASAQKSKRGAVRQRSSRDPAMLRRPHWRCLGGQRPRSSGQTFRVWPRN